MGVGKTFGQRPECILRGRREIFYGKYIVDRGKLLVNPLLCGGLSVAYGLQIHGSFADFCVLSDAGAETACSDICSGVRNAVRHMGCKLSQICRRVFRFLSAAVFLSGNVWPFCFFMDWPVQWEKRIPVAEGILLWFLPSASVSAVLHGDAGGSIINSWFRLLQEPYMEAYAGPGMKFLRR